MNNLETGDLLLFVPKDDYRHGFVKGFLSAFNDFVGWVTGSKYTHSALIIRNPEFTSTPLKGLYVLESSYETFPDAENGEYKLGVELEDFMKLYEEWPGEIYLRKLHCNRDKIFYERLAKAHSVVHNRPYDLFPQDWARAGLKEKEGSVTQEKTRFWCSALVTYVYTQLGLLPPDTPWSMITCKSLGTEKGNQLKLHFQNCTLDPEVRIK